MKRFFYRLKKAAPVILTATTVVGIAAVAYISSQDTKKHIEMEEEEQPFTLREKTGCYVRSYWRTGVVCAITMGSAVMSTIIGSKNAAGYLATAVALENRFTKYRDTVKEKVGDEVEEDIYIEAFKPDWAVFPLIPDSGNMEHQDIKLFYDVFLERFFWSTDIRVHDALYHLNRNFVQRHVVFLSEYCYFLGIDFGDEDIEMGWYDEDLLEAGLNPWIDYKSPKYDDGRPRPRTKDGIEYTEIYPAIEPTVDAVKGFL